MKKVNVTVQIVVEVPEGDEAYEVDDLTKEEILDILHSLDMKDLSDFWDENLVK